MRAEINLSPKLDHDDLPYVFSTRPRDRIVETTLQYELVHVVIHMRGGAKNAAVGSQKESRFMWPVKEN
ncbi:MAG: hypothetical protein LC794_09785 [Acidobacteria bacterium]|nr:hypothetical protein [Acidobacteriota bacterium]